MSTQITKTKNTIAWVLSVLLVLLYLGSAWAKLFRPEQMIEMQLADWRVIIASAEIVLALLILIPKFNKYTTLLLSSYMGGAIATHMIWSINIIIPVVTLLVVWSVFYLRNPEFFE